MREIGVESDDNSVRVRFKLPKTVGDNIDLQTMSIKINFRNAIGQKGVYIVNDIEELDGFVTFSWLFSKLVTVSPGIVKFVVCARKTDEDDKVIVEWNTAVAELCILGGVKVKVPSPTPEEEDAISQAIIASRDNANKAVQSAQQAKEEAERVLNIIPVGGTKGQVLTKQSDEDKDYSWQDPASGGGAGQNGATFMPSVSTEGTISWTNDRGLPNPEPVNIKGDKGDKGESGTDGKTPIKGVDYWTDDDKHEMELELSQNIIDSTLTQKGKAADAGAVGEFVSRFTYENAADITADLEWTRGYYSGGNLGDFKDSELTRTSILEAKAGEKFIVTGYPYYKCLLYFIVEGENVTKRHPESGQSIQSNVKIECGSDCKIYFGSDANKLSGFKVEKIKKEFKDIVFSHDVEVTDYEDITSEISFAEGGYYKFSDLSYVEDPSSESAVINCAAGEMYRISGRSYYNMKNVVVSSGTKRIVHYPVKYGEQYSVNEFVVPESADKLYLARRTSETDIFKIEKIKSVLRKPKSGIEMANKSDNPLYGKTAVFDGDSICAGKTSDYHTNGFGYAGRIGVKNCMNWINYGIGGGTITSGTKDSSEKDRHWVSTNIAKIKEEYPNADYLILESCLNDGFNKLPIDELSEGYDEEYDPTRFTGAVEYMLKSALTLFPSAKIGVVIPHRVSIDLNKWHDVVRAACKKWNVPYIDLYYLSGINVNVEEQNKIMFSDGVTHLTAEAYERISAQIEKWMRTL